MFQVSQLFIYPVKSLGGIKFENALVTDRGLQYDRRYMLVDENKRCLTQREYPAMALLQAAIEGNELLVYHKKSAEVKLRLPLIPVNKGDVMKVLIWEDVCEAVHVSQTADDWFSEQIGISCRLVYMPESSKRNVDLKYALKDDITSFSDGYPLLIIGQSSLDDLNSRLQEALPMNRFRPNIVFTGGLPFEEDTMEHFTINGIHCFAVKPSERCVVTTTNQETSITGKEPLKTLATYRRVNNNVLFGQNLLTEGTGILRVGDAIEVIKTKPALLL
ncbi:MAG: MOSC domain-containing protein [Bacteroidota bacterium]|nr:MOSC domain-containing protein [Bacteroidota bacterium]